MRLLHRIVTLGLSSLRRRLSLYPGFAPAPALAFGLVSTLACAACAAEPPRAAHSLTPIPEDRARELIVRTFRDAGMEAETNRFVEVGKDVRRVRLEVAAAGRKFGVAYLTSQDWSEVGDSLPPRSTDGKLVVARAREGTRILCLFAADYGEDDETGETRNATTIAADRRLERDVRDFLHRAQEQSWP
jgi:hypothetical protein